MILLKISWPYELVGLIFDKLKVNPKSTKTLNITMEKIDDPDPDWTG